MPKEQTWKWIVDNQPLVLDISDRIWEYAELGLQEFKSSALLVKTLEEHGFAIECGVADMPTAFTATFGSGHPVIGIMGEYDALPGLSQKAVPQREAIEEGAPGHGCGHNIHGTSGMAAAIAAKTVMERNRTKGTVKFFGCPAEENYSGKVFMVRAGVFGGVDAALSHHPWEYNYAPMSSSLSVNSVKFHFHGVASHAAAHPDMGRSALDAVELMNVGVNFMREHIVQEARIHYVTEKGGQQPNIVPPYARTWYYVRAPEREQVQQIYDWVLRIADAADIMARTTHEVQFIEGTYNRLPNRCLADIVTSNMRTIGAPKYTKEEMEFASRIDSTVPREEKTEDLRRTKRPGWERLMDVMIDESIPDPWDEGEVEPGSTDVADVSWQAPTMEFYTSTYVLGVPAHSWQSVALSGMSIGHKSLIFAAKAMAGSVMDLLEKPELLKKAQEEFIQRKAGRKYTSPIPSHIRPPIEVAREAAEGSKHL